MDRKKFEELVASAIADLPDEFTTRLVNIVFVVEDNPDTGQMRDAGLRRGQTLLGLYEGVPQTKRGAHYGLVLPDKITIFQKPIEAMCTSEKKIIAEIQSVVKHEIAHHFGISDGRLRQLGK